MIFEQFKPIELSSLFLDGDNFEYKLDIIYKEFLKLTIEDNKIIKGYENLSNFCFVNVAVNSLFILKNFIEVVKFQHETNILSGLLYQEYQNVSNFKFGNFYNLIAEIFKINSKLNFFKTNATIFKPETLMEGDPVEFLNMVVEYTGTSNLFLWNDQLGINNEITQSFTSRANFLDHLTRQLDMKNYKNKYILLNFAVGNQTIILPHFNIGKSIFILSSIGLATREPKDGSISHFETIYRLSKNNFRFISDSRSRDLTFKRIYKSNKVRYLIYEYWGEKIIQNMLLPGLEPKKVVVFKHDSIDFQRKLQEELSRTSIELQEKFQSEEMEDPFIDDKLTEEYISSQLNVENENLTLNYDEFTNYNKMINEIDHFEDGEDLDGQITYQPLLDMFSYENKVMNDQMDVDEFNFEEESDESSDESSEYDDDPIEYTYQEEPIYLEDYEALRAEERRKGKRRRKITEEEKDPDYSPYANSRGNSVRLPSNFSKTPVQNWIGNTLKIIPEEPLSVTLNETKIESDITEEEYENYKMNFAKLIYDLKTYIYSQKKPQTRAITNFEYYAKCYTIMCKTNQNKINPITFLNSKPHYNPSDETVELRSMLDNRYKTPTNTRNMRLVTNSTNLGSKIITSLKRNPLIPRYKIHPYICGIIHYINLLKVQVIRNQYNYVEMNDTDTLFPLSLRSNIFTESFRLNKQTLIENTRYHFYEDYIPNLVKRRHRFSLSINLSNKFDIFIERVKKLKK